MWRPHWRGAGDSQLPRPPDVATSESNSLLNPIYTDLWRNRQCSSESKIVSPNTKRRRRDQERRLSNPYRRSSGPACGCAGLQRRGRRRSPVRNSGRSSRRRGKRKRNLRLEVNNNGPELGSMRGPVVKWWAVKLSNLEPCWPRGKYFFLFLNIQIYFFYDLLITVCRSSKYHITDSTGISSIEHWI